MGAYPTALTESVAGVKGLLAERQITRPRRPSTSGSLPGSVVLVLVNGFSQRRKRFRRRCIRARPRGAQSDVERVGRDRRRREPCDPGVLPGWRQILGQVLGWTHCCAQATRMGRFGRTFCPQWRETGQTHGHEYPKARTRNQRNFRAESSYPGHYRNLFGPVQRTARSAGVPGKP